MVDTTGIGTKTFFWFVLASFSVFFAEVLSGSFLFPFFDMIGYLVLIPLYGAHVVVLMTLAVRWGKRSFLGLFSSGLLFGLYEAYITKDLFYPPDGHSPLFFLEVDWLQVSFLVLFWHMFMAFIVPVLLAMVTLTTSGDVSPWLPGPVRALLSDRRRTVLAMFAFLVWAGAFMGGNADPIEGPLAAASGGAIIYGLAWLWRRRTGGSLKVGQLLPNKRGLYLLIAFMVIWCYIVLGGAFGSEGLPGITGHIVMIGIYALCLTLIVLNLNGPGESGTEGPKVELPALKPKIGLLMVLALTASIAVSSLTGIGKVVIIVSYIAGSVLGLVSLVAAVISAVKNAMAYGMRN